MIKFFQKRKTIVTHDSSFHADDLFACATLKILYPNAKIIRTRDEKIIQKGDIVLDVGEIYDEDKKRFDHHQKEGAGFHDIDTSIPYASFGLIWKHFGLEICGGDKDVWRKIEKNIVLPIDATDNGVSTINLIGNVSPYFAPETFLAFSPSWKEDKSNIDKIFLEQVEKVKTLLLREIKVAKDDIDGERLLEKAYQDAEDKRFLIVDVNMPRPLYQGYLPVKSEVCFLIYPSSDKKSWKAESIRADFGTMNSRRYFPQNWRGLGEEKLREVTGIDDAIFCHRAGFLVMAETFESVKKMVEIALQN
ncbi:MYG1 family protein [Candidatus Nomurabacteria bacterium]|nr:MYG1 family protein [Candidatus Nomurabacteria bacterium]